MYRFATPFLLLLASCLCRAQDEWLGMYLQGKKIGYSSFSKKTVESGTYAESVSIIDGKMLGFGLSIKVTSRTWSDKDGKATRMEFDLDSGGRAQKVVAIVEGAVIKA